MILELIIQQIKVLGNLKVRKMTVNEDNQEIVQEQRRFRVKIGQQTFISKSSGQFISSNQLHFNEPFSYMYDNFSHLLFIQIFNQHSYLDNSDLDQVLTAEVDLSDLTSLNGDYVESPLFDIEKQQVGKIILTIQTFKKGHKYFEKVSSKIFFQAVKEQQERQVQATEAAKNIKNLMVNNTIPDTLMTISAMTLICEKQDNQIYMREGFIMVRYGINIKAFSTMVKMISKQNANWLDYLQFMKNDGAKFQFFFFHNDDLGNIICKAKGQIKYVVFDQTINLHTIALYDKRSNKYGVLMVKFNEKEVDKVNINNKMDKKVGQVQPSLQDLIQQFNRFKFESKNNNHILSQKVWELEQKAQIQEEQKQRPLNPEQKKKQEQHSRFISFLQKEMIRIQRQLTKRQEHNKKDNRKNMFLPTIQKKLEDKHVDKKLKNSISSNQFNKIKLPKI